MAASSIVSDLPQPSGRLMPRDPLEWSLISLISVSSVDVAVFGLESFSDRAAIARGVLVALSTAVIVFSFLRIATSHRGLSGSWLAGPQKWIGLWLVWAVGAGLILGYGNDVLLDTTPFVAALAGVIAVLRRSSISAFVRILAGALAMSSAFGLAAWALGQADIFDGGRLRLLFLEPNQLARAAGVTAVAVAGAVLASVDRRSGFQRTTVLNAGLENPASMAIVGLASAIVVGTQSRTGALAAAIGLCILASFFMSRIIVGALVLAIVAAGILISVTGLWGAAAEVVSRDEVGTVEELGTFNGRTVLWPEVISDINQRPVVGFGLGSDRAIVGQYQVQGRIVWHPEHTHNWLLQLVLTTGVVGAGLIVAGLIGALRNQRFLHNPTVLAILAVLVVDGISEPVMRVSSFGFAAFVGCLVMSPSPGNADDVPSEPDDTRTQLSDEITVLTKSSISSTARS